MGFTGVICTDALEMKAISSHYAPADAAVAALNAGADILLMPSDLRAAFDGVVQAVENGTVAEERLNESVRRILTLKEKAGVLLEALVPAEEPVVPKPAEEPATEKSSGLRGWLKLLWN